MKNFEELIEVLCKEKIEPVSLTKNDPALKERFYTYLKEKYGKYLQRLAGHPEIEQQMIKDWYLTELRHWGNLSVDAIYSQFTPDQALLKIDTYSGMIFALANKKLAGDALSGEDADRAKEYVSQMNALLGEVLQENIAVAKKLISEGTVEADYICGETQNISIRLSNISRYSPKDE